MKIALVNKKDCIDELTSELETAEKTVEALRRRIKELSQEVEEVEPKSDQEFSSQKDYKSNDKEQWFAINL
ncbi:unnamed protein product [Meloidogyne enterolobii]|uniref:Uncharacterized protein n=1 Tax=Meloidogyne enterolobii TaxID=390850 RepID=A0ACB1AJW8_MELEN